MYLPLVGENRDNDDNEGAHAHGPDERERGNACLRGRHRPLTVHAGACAVKFWPFLGVKPVNTIDGEARSLHAGSSMSRTPNAKQAIFAFVARISPR